MHRGNLDAPDVDLNFVGCVRRGLRVLRQVLARLFRRAERRRGRERPVRRYPRRIRRRKISCYQRCIGTLRHERFRFLEAWTLVSRSRCDRSRIRAFRRNSTRSRGNRLNSCVRRRLLLGNRSGCGSEPDRRLRPHVGTGSVKMLAPAFDEHSLFYSRSLGATFMLRRREHRSYNRVDRATRAKDA